MYKSLTVSDLNRLEKVNIKEEIKMSILSLGVSLGGVSVNFSIDKTRRKESPAEIRNRIEEDLLINKVMEERKDQVAEMYITNGFGLNGQW